MANKRIAFTDTYTSKVGGESYSYEIEYTPGSTVEWNARVYHDGELKGTPGGTIIENTMEGEALRQYLIAYVESIIEKGLGIEE